ncbi:MAG: gamma-glutamyl-phosphate reductase, partial [Coprobacillus sp.]
FLPEMVRAFEGRIEIRGDIKTQEIIECQKATLEDYATEYDDYIVAIKVVHSLDEVIDHIYKYSTKHSECIVTENNQTAQIFLTSLDSACVYHNASTRFSDGGEFGFGAELGISTQKLHARGPLALLEMTSSQYRIEGNGQVRE